MASDGAVDFSTSTKAKVFAKLAGTPKGESFDVIAYIPAAAGWEPAQPFAKGYYATSLSRTEQEDELRVAYWSSSDTLASAPFGGILGLYEKNRVGTVSGKVTDKDNNPLKDAIVMVNGDLWAFTDDSGVYTIEDVPVGEVKVKVNGAGIEGSEQSVSVTQGTEAKADQKVTFDPSTIKLIPLSGTVKDKLTDAGVEAVKILLKSGPTFSTEVTTDSSGAYTADVPDCCCVAFELVREDYAIHWNAYIYSRRTEGQALGPWDFGISPLPKEFYGSWTYSHTVNAKGEEVSLDSVDTGVETRTVDTETFHANGTAEWAGKAGYWLPRNLQDKPNTWFIEVPQKGYSALLFPWDGLYRVEGEQLINDLSQTNPFISQVVFNKGQASSGGECNDVDYREISPVEAFKVAAGSYEAFCAKASPEALIPGFTANGDYTITVSDNRTIKIGDQHEVQFPDDVSGYEQSSLEGADDGSFDSSLSMGTFSLGFEYNSEEWHYSIDIRADCDTKTKIDYFWITVANGSDNLKPGFQAITCGIPGVPPL